MLFLPANSVLPRSRCLLAAAVLAAIGAAAATPSLRAQKSPTVPAYASLASLPFADLKTALEQAGWPAAHVQAVLGAEIQHRLNPTPVITASDLRPFEFWRTGPDAQPIPPAPTRERSEEQSRREDAVRQAFDTLFPASAAAPESDALLAWEDRRRWGNLPAEKRAAVSRVLDRAERERRALFDQRGGMLTRSEWDTAWKIADDARTELAGLLTPEELLDFDLRNSVTAERMRSELDNFQPSRAEFITIFQLRHPLELAFGHKPPGIDASLGRARTDAESAVEKQLASALGANRYGDYCLSLQPACQTLQFDGRFARADAAAIRKLYRSLLATKTRLAHLASADPTDANATEAAKCKDALYREFRTVLDEEGTRRYLQEQSLWP
jgi:hypothetical protein